MPFMDGTGPLGNGPGAGSRSGIGQGMGRGRETGCRMGVCQRRASVAAADRKPMMEQQAGLLERQVARIKRQLSGLAGGQPSK
jgi:hypothetical protein